MQEFIKKNIFFMKKKQKINEMGGVLNKSFEES